MLAHMNKYVTIVSLTFFAISCGHHKDVRAAADGNHRVVVVSTEKENGSREAIEQANHFCKDDKMKAFVVSETQKYSGDMDENTYNNMRRVSKVAKTVGTGIYVGGGEKESDIGGIVGLGGAATEEALGEGYTTEMIFQCR